MNTFLLHAKNTVGGALTGIILMHILVGREPWQEAIGALIGATVFFWMGRPEPAKVRSGAA